jgi:hypothetical protein
MATMELILEQDPMAMAGEVMDTSPGAVTAAQLTMAMVTTKVAQATGTVATMAEAVMALDSTATALDAMALHVAMVVGTALPQHLHVGYVLAHGFSLNLAAERSSFMRKHVQSSLQQHQQLGSHHKQAAVLYKRTLPMKHRHYHQQQQEQQQHKPTSSR